MYIRSQNFRNNNNNKVAKKCHQHQHYNNKTNKT